ncbi:MAG TPA: molybdopterin-binding protein [Candidatus Limnocylindrales bacterium]
MEITQKKARPLRTAVLLAVGSELTVGETRDTNSGELARSLADSGVEVAWISALPDRLETVAAALTGALTSVDLVVTTGGLGPTPDDLTREAIAQVCRETPIVDPELASWLRHLFERRGIAFPETNLKQAWLIPSSTAIPNANGTAPGWWVDLPNGAVIVALPGPPSEMRPMWDGWVRPRLMDRGLGRERIIRTYRLTGVGESAAAALLGEDLLRAANPVVATYARTDAVDVRISAVAEAGRSAAEVAAEAEATVLAAVGEFVWGRDTDTWPQVLGRALERQKWNAALVEVGTGGAAARLFGEVPWLKGTRSIAAGDPSAKLPLAGLAREAGRSAGAWIGLAVRAAENGDDTRVELAAVGPWGVTETSQMAFLGGAEGHRRAGIAAAAFLNDILRASAPKANAAPATGGE